MSEVSCRAFTFFAAAHRAGLVDMDQLLEGCPIPRAELEQPSTRVSWDEWTVLCDRFAALVGSEEALVNTGEFILSDGFSGFFRRAVGLFTSARMLYDVAFRWAGPSLYRSLAFTTGPGGPGEPHRFRLRVELLPGFKPCRAWFLLCEASMKKVPSFIGLRDSTVERVELSETVGEWLVDPPASRSMVRYLKRIWAAFVTPSVLMHELYDAQQQLDQAFGDMRRSTVAFRNALDAMPLLIVVHDRGTILHVNQTAAHVFGEAPAALIGRSLGVLFAEEVAQSLAPLLTQTIDAPVDLHIDRDGVKRQFEMRSVAGVEFGGRQAGLLFALDVTAELEARGRAERSEAAVATLVGYLPDLIMRIDKVDGQPRIREVLGGTAFEEMDALRSLVGRTTAEFGESCESFGPGLLAEVLNDLEAAFASGRPTSRNVSFQTRSGQHRDLVVRMETLPGHDEVLVIVHDDTEEREVERRLAIAERMASLGTMSAAIAHEVNNPLMWVLGNLEMLQGQLRELDCPEEVHQLVDEIRDGTRRIRDTIARVREFSRFQKSPKVPVRLDEVVSAASRMVENEVRHQAVVTLDLIGHGRVLGDPIELGQLVANLLLNAAQAMPAHREPDAHSGHRGAGGPSGRIEVALREERAEAVLTVSDNAGGIPPENLARIFDPFFTTKPAPLGTGLGLAIVHRIATDHGGTIDVDSRLGEGTRFVLRLPLTQTAVKPRAKTSPHLRVASVPANVLVIDDEPLVARTIARGLRGHKVTVCGNAAEGLEKLVSGELPELVLCDLMMPGMTGIDLYEALAKARPEAIPRLVFMTGGTFTGPAEDFVTSTTCPVMQKPIPMEVLQGLVADALARGAEATAGA